MKNNIITKIKKETGITLKTDFIGEITTKILINIREMNKADIEETTNDLLLFLQMILLSIVLEKTITIIVGIKCKKVVDTVVILNLQHGGETITKTMLTIQGNGVIADDIMIIKPKTMNLENNK